MKNDGVTATDGLMALTSYLARTGDAELLTAFLREHAAVFAQTPGMAAGAALLEDMAKQVDDE